jgi:hypothetical protein
LFWYISKLLLLSFDVVLFFTLLYLQQFVLFFQSHSPPEPTGTPLFKFLGVAFPIYLNYWQNAQKQGLEPLQNSQKNLKFILFLFNKKKIKNGLSNTKNISLNSY